MPDLLLGLDVGTSSARAMVFTPDGVAVGAAQTGLLSTQPAAGRVEQDPAMVWEAVQQALAQALANAGCAPGDVASLGVTTQRSSVVIWERASGHPVAPMVVWNDLRGGERAAQLQAEGFPVMNITAAAKLEGVLAALPDGRQRAHAGELAWGTLESYLVYRLTDGKRHITDRSCAWSTAYLDFFDPTRWNEALIAHQGLPLEFFPTLCDTTGNLGVTDAQVFGAAVPLGAMVGDQQAGMFAHQALEAGQWKATFGTSGVLMIATGEVLDVSSGLVPMALAGWGDKTLLAAEGMVRSAGEMLPWAIGQGFAQSVEEVCALAGQTPDAGGVSVLPALHGLGTPHNNPTASVAVWGRSATTTAAHLARAVLEGVALRMAEIVDLAVTHHPIDPTTALPVDGGLTRSDAFCQILADLLARPVTRLHQVEATAWGAARAGAQGVGVEIADSTDFCQRFNPTLTPTEARQRLHQWQAQTLNFSQKKDKS
jgi:glycerol kinase